MQFGVGGTVMHQGLASQAARPSAVHPAGISHPVHFADRVLQARIEFASSAILPRRVAAKQTESTKRGLRFEARVTAALHSAFPARFVSQLPFSFQTNSKRGRAIPDGILLSQRERAACIIEIKARHTSDAWWQLERFYAPIIREALPGFRICLLEICGVYDPAVKLPKAAALLERPEDVFETRECFHPVYVTRKGLA